VPEERRTKRPPKRSQDGGSVRAPRCAVAPGGQSWPLAHRSCSFVLSSCRADLPSRPHVRTHTCVRPVSATAPPRPRRGERPPSGWGRASVPPRANPACMRTRCGSGSVRVGLFHREPERARVLVEPWLRPNGKVLTFFDLPTRCDTSTRRNCVRRSLRRRLIVSIVVIIPPNSTIRSFRTWPDNERNSLRIP
jgi:hypothetical protein